MDWNGVPLRPLSGGYSAETFLVGDDSDEKVLRIYGRNPDRCLVDAGLLRLLRGVLPVPVIVDVRAPDGDQPGLLVTEKLPGTRMDLVLPDASAELRRAMGVSLGQVLARLSGIPMLRFGMFEGPDLHLRDDADVAAGLAAWAQYNRAHGRLAAWREDDWEALLALLDAAEAVATGEGTADPGDQGAHSRHVLVHSDLNPKNVLVDDEDGTVTGVLDWEFAHAGSPYADLGNLTRFERQRDFVEAVLTTFVEHAPALGDDPVRRGRAADLWALVELAGRVPTNPVADLATELLLAQAREGDLMAWPWDTPRVDPAAGQPVS